MTTGLREQKKAATRRALTEAVLRLSGDRGFDHVTVEQVADEVGVSPRTFFNYFPSREAAVFGDDADRVDAVRTAFAARPVDEPLPVALGEALLATLGDDVTRSVASLVARARVVSTSPALLGHQMAAYARLEVTLTELVAARTRLPVEHPYPALVAASVGNCLRLALIHWVGVRPAMASQDQPGDRPCVSFDAPLPDPAGLYRWFREGLQLLVDGLAVVPDG